ncbi:MAG: hypothetical protein ACXVY3_04795 [Gaiellaceae bacterium]
MPHRLFVLACAALVAAALASAAQASQLIDRDASGARLEVNENGMAMLTYTAHGKLRHTLAWGAINALPPTKGQRQTKFQLDYSGGSVFHRQLWKNFKNVCGPYSGPPLAWLVVACTMPDGSNWALQSWQRGLPNVGMPALNQLQSAWELRLSHWNTDLALLDMHVDWAYRKYDHLWGRYTYLGQPIYGFSSTTRGAPLDSWGRLIYVDTYNSVYGDGWKRENSFLSHNPTGIFCYGFYANQSDGGRPPGTGQFYRATASGPGVTPDVFWQSSSPGPYDKAKDQEANALQREFFGADRICKPN